MVNVTVKFNKKNKKMFVKKIDELSQETDAMLGEFDKW